MVRITFAFICALVSSASYAETPPIEVQTIINETVSGSRLLNSFDQDKSSIGFLTGDEIAGITAGVPVRIYSIPKQVLTTCSNSDPINSLIRPKDAWFVPLAASGRMRCFLLVSKENGVWTDVSIGYTYLARAWDKINQAWPQRNIVLIDVAWLNSYYFHIPDVNSTNLTLIQPTPENPEVGLAKISAEYSVLQTNVESISNLKNIMNKGR